MRKLASLVLIAQLCLPSIAAAAFTEPADVLQAMQEVKASNLSYEFHVQVPEQKVFVSAWIEGTTSGQSADMSGDMRMTIDVVAPYTTVRSKIQARLVDGKIYVSIDSVDGDIQHELMSFVAKLQGKKWFMFTLPEEVMAEMGRQDQTIEGAFRDVANELFTFSGKNGAYTLTLKPEAGAKLAEFMETSGNPFMPGMVDDDMLELLDRATLDIKASASGDTLTEASFVMTARMRESGEVITLKASGTVVPRSKPATVTAPTPVVDLEKYISEQMGFPMMGTSSWEDASDSSDWSESDWEADEIDWSDYSESSEEDGAADSWNWDVPETDTESSAYADCEDLSPTERIMAVRTGQCGDRYESRRSLNERMNSTPRQIGQ